MEGCCGNGDDGGRLNIDSICNLGCKLGLSLDVKTTAIRAFLSVQIFARAEVVSNLDNIIN